MKHHTTRVTKYLPKKALQTWIGWFRAKEISIRLHERKGKFSLWREEFQDDGENQFDEGYPGESALKKVKIS